MKKNYFCAKDMQFFAKALQTVVFARSISHFKIPSRSDAILRKGGTVVIKKARKNPVRLLTCNLLPKHLKICGSKKNYEL